MKRSLSVRFGGLLGGFVVGVRDNKSDTVETAAEQESIIAEWRMPRDKSGAGSESVTKPRSKSNARNRFNPFPLWDAFFQDANALTHCIVGSASKLPLIYEPETTFSAAKSAAIWCEATSTRAAQPPGPGGGKASEGPSSKAPAALKQGLSRKTPVPPERTGPIHRGKDFEIRNSPQGSHVADGCR